MKPKTSVFRQVKSDSDDDDERMQYNDEKPQKKIIETLTEISTKNVLVQFIHIDSVWYELFDSVDEALKFLADLCLYTCFSFANDHRQTDLLRRNVGKTYSQIASEIIEEVKRTKTFRIIEYKEDNEEDYFEINLIDENVTLMKPIVEKGVIVFIENDTLSDSDWDLPCYKDSGKKFYKLFSIYRDAVEYIRENTINFSYDYWMYTFKDENNNEYSIRENLCVNKELRNRISWYTTCDIVNRFEEDE